MLISADKLYDMGQKLGSILQTIVTIFPPSFGHNSVLSSGIHIVHGFFQNLPPCLIHLKQYVSLLVFRHLADATTVNSGKVHYYFGPLTDYVTEVMDSKPCELLTGNHGQDACQ